ncbi:MAG: cupin domain-containing protein [Bacteroidota bacterium]
MKVKKASEEEIRKTINWGTWKKEPSEFPWFYDEKETCYIMEGRASVKDNDSNEITFGPGDFVEFEKGLHCTWIIHETIRKKYNFG